MTWDQLHDEDILFEFRGNRPDQLTPGRFYRGVVDGFADFGVFIDIGDGVTGLLHRSQLKQRLESLDWEVGDEVVVQVDGVRDNGNVDLSWSIRQSAAEFRGRAIDDPNSENGAEPLPPEDTETATTPEPEPPVETATASGAVSESEPAAAEAESEPRPESEPDSDLDPDPGRESPEPSAEATPTREPETEPSANTEAPSAEVDGAERLERIPVAAAPDRVGDTVRIDGRVTNVRQTSGPTIFEITDESGDIEGAAFEAPGVRSYAGVDVNDVVRVVGVVERHRDSIQIEVDELVSLDEGDATAVTTRLEEAVTEQARPQEPSLLEDDDPTGAIMPALEDAATALRRAAIESRPVILRHPATVDGYVGAAALERAVTRVIEDEHEESHTAARLVSRRPMGESWYELGDAFYDVPDDSDANPPVVVLVGAGASDEDRDALDLLGLYGIDRIVIDTIDPADGDDRRAEHVLVAPGDGPIQPTATTVAANLASVTAPAVRQSLFHLPAISYWGPVPDIYRHIARDNGFDEETVRQRREAIALVAYYQRYDDKRELVTDLLFDGEQAGELAAHVSRQYREKVETAVEIATANREQFSVTGGQVTLLDVATLHHPRSFPPTPLLVGELRERWAAGPDHAIVAIGQDTCYLAGSTVDLEALAARLSEAVQDAGVSARRDRLTFLAGKRDEIQAALVDEFAATFDASSTRS